MENFASLSLHVLHCYNINQSPATLMEDRLYSKTKICWTTGQSLKRGTTVLRSSANQKQWMYSIPSAQTFRNTKTIFWTIQILQQLHFSTCEITSRANQKQCTDSKYAYPFGFNWLWISSELIILAKSLLVILWQGSLQWSNNQEVHILQQSFAYSQISLARC